MIDLGADGLAFDTIVASGPNGAIPHHSPGDRAFARGDLITIDCGARFGGYHADMTRTVALGEPAAWQREIYELVAAAQLAGVGAAVPGADVATSTRPPGTSSTRPVTAGTSATAWATALAWRCTKRR